MSEIVLISRREFLKAGAIAGAGLILGVHLPARAAQEQPKPPYAPPNAFLHIGEDNRVTVFVNKAEMGQGVYTSIPMLVAEELEVDWSQVRAEPAPVDPIFANPTSHMQQTGGSTSIRTEYQRMREVGAAARIMLIAAAAQNWGVTPQECRAENGRVLGPGGRSLEYGRLTRTAASMPVPQQFPLKDPAEFRIVGKPTPRLDTPPKLNGQALFASDIRIPGLLTVLVERPPVYGGKVKAVRDAKARQVPGVVQVAQIPSGVAVAATTFYAAQRGREALEVDWEEGPRAGLATDRMHQEYRELAKTPGLVARKDGNPERVLAQGGKVLDVTYELPYLAHADMEPLSCAVDLRQEGCEVWVGTQNQTATRDTAARISGLRPDQVTVHTTYLGGGFGRRGNPHSDFVALAMEVAVALKRPVLVLWTREDDMKGGYYRPLWHARMLGAVDAGGKATAWQHRIIGQSIMKGTFNEKRRIKNGIDLSSVEGAEQVPYEIPNVLVELHTPEKGMPVQWWRSVGHSHTGFEVESFVDELAHLAGKDPYQFRRSLLANHPRHRGVLELAARQAGWGAPLPDGHGRGIAVFESYGSYVCEVAEVSVAQDGAVRVHRVVCAVDCGQTVNPMTIEAQMEGGIVFGLAAALHGAITLKNGRVQQGNFDDYPLLAMDEMPRIEVHIVKNREKPGGIGETAVPPAAPALTNAIFAATGTRIRRLPVDPNLLKSA